MGRQSDQTIGAQILKKSFQISVGTALLVAVLSMVVGTAALIHFPWFNASNRHVQELVAQLNLQIIASTQREVDKLVMGAEAARSAAMTVLNERVIMIDEEAKREFLFLSFLQAQPSLSRIVVGWKNGSSFSTYRPDDKNLIMQEIRWDPVQNSGHLRIDRYDVHSDGSIWYRRPANGLREGGVSNEFAPDQMWYQQAENAEFQPWSDAYVRADNGRVSISSSRYFELNNGEKSVLSVAIELDRLGKFLDQLNIGKNGIAFVADVNNQLVAAAPKLEPSLTHPVDPARLKRLGEASAPLIRLAGDALFQSGTTLREVARPQQFRQTGRDNVPYFVTIAPIGRLNWVVVTVVPESDFLSEIEANSDRLMMLVPALLVITAVIAVFATRQLMIKPLGRVTKALQALEAFRLDAVPSADSRLTELVQLNDAIGRMAKSLASFRKFLPRVIVEDMFKRGIEAQLGGEQKTLTLFFMDLANFTQLSERMGPQLIPFLGEYLDAMSRVIQHHGGTIDKYIGDAIMAFWNAPDECADHAEKAMAAALACQELLAQMSAQNLARKLPALNARIGINTGEVLVGYVGSPDRLNYTAIGDPVNLASRLESLNKYYGTTILVGEDAIGSCGGLFHVRHLDRVAVAGKSQPVEIYELVSDRKTVSYKPEWAQSYETALAAYRRQEWDLAAEEFKQVQRLKTDDDPASALMLERINDYRKNPPPKPWDAVASFTQK